MEVGMLRSIVCALGTSLFLVACGGAQKEAKTADEGNPWADYKGTYATTANPKPSDTSEAKKDAKNEKKAKADKGEPKVEKTEKAVATGTDEKKPASKGTINGESVSSIGVDTLATVSKSTLKAKGATTSFVLGKSHEQLKVSLKSGVTVEIIRPAAYPDPDGTISIPQPKERNGQLSKGETSWYDADADVIVVVNAAKKPAAQKALNQLLKN
jgi:hypothetical protein